MFQEEEISLCGSGCSFKLSPVVLCIMYLARYLYQWQVIIHSCTSYLVPCKIFVPMIGNTSCTSYHVPCKIFVPMIGNTSCTLHYVPCKIFVPMTGNNSCTSYHVPCKIFVPMTGNNT